MPSGLLLRVCPVLEGCLYLIESQKKRFFCSLFWFGAVSVCHLNWFLSDKYVGFYINIFLVLFSLYLGFQFALITLFIRNPKEMGIWHLLGISGGWVLLEWSRLHILSGYSWDPVGFCFNVYARPACKCLHCLGCTG